MRVKSQVLSPHMHHSPPSPIRLNAPHKGGVPLGGEPTAIAIRGGAMNRRIFNTSPQESGGSDRH